MSVDGGNSDSVLMVRPNQPTDLYINGMLMSDWEPYLARRPTALVEISYDERYANSRGVFQSEPFELTKELLGIK